MYSTASSRSFTGFDIFQGHGHPSFHQPCPHGRNGAVDDVDKGFSPFKQGMKKFQVADGEFVKPYIMFFLDPGQGGNVFYLTVFGKIEILRMAPAAIMPSLRLFTPNPFSEVVSKCFSSLSVAVSSVNIQSSSL